MSAQLLTWNGINIKPQYDALTYETAIPSSGFIYGGNITIKDANTLHIATGFGLICGRQFLIDAQDTLVTLSSSGTLQGRVYLHLDLSNASLPLELLIETGSSLTPPIQDNEVNVINGVYEIDIAMFSVNETTIFNLQDINPRIEGGGGSNLAVVSSETTTTAFNAGDYLLYGNALYRVTASIPVGGTLRPNINIHAITVMQEVQSINTGGIFQILQSGWTLNSSNLYEYTINATTVYSPTPDISLSGATVGAQATSAEESAFNTLTAAGHYAETSDNTVHLFAKSAPSSDFYILIKGVA